MSLIHQRPAYRLRGMGHHARAIITKATAEAELLAARVPSETVSRRQAVNGFGKLGYVRYTVFPLAEVRAWVEKGALDWSWVRCFEGGEFLSYETFISRLVAQRLDGQPVSR